MVPLYFKAQTPTLSERREQQENLFFCKVSILKLISTKIAFAFTDGNAASDNTRSYYDLKKLDKLKWGVINSEFWTDKKDGKRIVAEFLIYPKIEIEYILSFP